MWTYVDAKKLKTYFFELIICSDGPVGTVVKKNRKVGRSMWDRSAFFFFFFLLGACAEIFRFSINWRWRVETDQVRDRGGRIEPVTSWRISARDVRLNFEGLEVNEQQHFRNETLQVHSVRVDEHVDVIYSGKFCQKLKFIKKIQGILQFESSGDVKNIKDEVQIARNCC